MFTDKLGRQFLKGQKVLLMGIPGILEADVTDVHEMSLARNSGEPPMKVLECNAVIRVRIPIQQDGTPSVYVIQSPEENENAQKKGIQVVQ